MSSFKIFDISGSGLAAESVRLNTIASNLANADSVTGSAATVYKARHPVFQAIRDAVASFGTDLSTDDQGADSAVRVAGIVQSNAPPLVTHDPGNPLADANGDVYSPNVNVIEEMTDMISASRAYQDNVDVMNTSKDLMLDTLKLGES
ncbi:MAG: flagellar basal body rod protein FlgC [Steroidobacteraceae bacterium]